jgi:AP-4 complex subunit epsilon-1
LRALVDSNSEFLILIINSTQRDLSSIETIKIALAFTAIAHLMAPELIPPVVGYVTQCLNHAVDLVRLKAIMTLHLFVMKDPACVIEFLPDLRPLLQDDDISIINAIVNTLTFFLDNSLNIRQVVDVFQILFNIWKG